MYRMSESEFMQYEMANKRLHDLLEKHAVELQQAYDDIHPTRTGYNYGLGLVYSESVNPAEYAIYLVELREEHERMEKWWRMRADAYQEAYSKLTDEDKSNLHSFGYGNFKWHEKARKALKTVLELIVSTRPELQRKFIPLDEIEDMDEADQRIDKMSPEELLEDYWDLDEAN